MYFFFNNLRIVAVYEKGEGTSGHCDLLLLARVRLDFLTQHSKTQNNSTNVYV